MNRNLHRWPAGLVGLLLLAACDSGTSPPAVDSVSVLPAAATLAPGEAVSFSATPRDADGNPIPDRPVTWSSSDPQVASVDEDGVATALEPGNALISASVEGRTGTAQLTVTPPPVATVRVFPGEVTLELGETLRLEVELLDGEGNLLADRSVNWSSGSPEVASVDGEGVVSAEGSGTATITATSEGVSGESQVTVPPPPVASVELSPGELTLAPGETAEMEAILRDALGNRLTDREVSWSSEDPSIASVDAQGLVRGEAVGTTLVTATSEGVTATGEVVVAEPESVVIESVNPSPLVEGGEASISGSGFALDPQANELRVDGVRAEITRAGEDSLSFIVPSFDCRPARQVELRLQVGSVESPPFSHPLHPPSFLELPVGEQVVFSDPSLLCLQLAPEAGEAEFLVGIQSVSSIPASLTPTTVTGRVGLAPSAALLVGARGSGPEPEDLGAQHWPEGDAAPGRVRVPTEDWRAAHHTAEMRIRSQEQELFRGRLHEMLSPAPASAPTSGLALGSVPETPVVGDTVPIRVPDWNGNLCDDFNPLTTVIRAVGERALWLEDVANPAQGFTEEEVAGFLNEFDNEVWDVVTGHFGEPTDFDGNGRIAIVATREVNRISGLGGFVVTADLFPRTTCASSDEGELYYAQVPDPDGTVGSPAPTANVLRNTRRLLPHEFTHIIQFGRRGTFEGATAFQTVWELEGQAQLSEEIMGHHFLGFEAGQNLGAGVALNNPALDEVWWYSGFLQLARYFGFGGTGVRVEGAPEECTFLGGPNQGNNGPCVNNDFVFYGVSWSLLRWLSDHFGPSFPGGEAEMHRALIENPFTGFQTFTDVLDIPFPELLVKWAATLYLDGRLDGGDPLLELPSWDLLDLDDRLVDNARLLPRDRGSSDFSDTIRVRGGSVGYFLLTGADRPATAVMARGSGGSPLPGTMRLWIVRIR